MPDQYDETVKAITDLGTPQELHSQIQQQFKDMAAQDQRIAELETEVARLREQYETVKDDFTKAGNSVIMLKDDNDTLRTALAAARDAMQSTSANIAQGEDHALVRAQARAFLNKAAAAADAALSPYAKASEDKNPEADK